MEIPFEVETFQLVLYGRNPAAPTMSDAERQRINLDHLAWASSQLKAGNAVLAGAIEDGADITGMGLFRVSPECVREIMAEDPVIKSRVDIYRLATFTTRAGALSTPRR